jgi:hypothetical protein
MDKRCKATTVSGAPCSAQPVRPSGYCYWHDPGASADRAEGRRQGGKARSNASRARKRMAAEALTPGELQGYVAVALKGVMVGSITPGVANAVASLARAVVAVREAVELESRLEELERAAGIDRRAS